MLNRNLIGNRSICIVGVDGTGKSSVCKLLKERLNSETAVVQYMGAKNWETGIARKYHESVKSHNMVNSFMYIVSFIFEMYYRVYKHRSGDVVVIFDRYVDEQVLIRENRGGGIKSRSISLLYKLFLRWLFPKPGFTFYLKCPISVSISRKDDLQEEKSIKSFVRNKALLDNYYGNKSHVTIIDTSVNNRTEVVDMILKRVKPYLTL